ncbi:UNVERIFIED_CONTAM: hypothetical protein Sradi_4012200 [Sesamum radiatum]|uniref:Retrotransposon gag domain-containing protein n=1 Tax=Sesamum radiatum TaxID=300843 RepID=A0AAW2PKN4_SESRA
MPTAYQPPKLQQFDGKGNPKQHIAHFIETCNNAGTDGDHLVKQFVRSLKGNAFDWYVDLEPESIDNWDEMEREFLNRFYSTRRTRSEKFTKLSTKESMAIKKTPIKISSNNRKKSEKSEDQRVTNDRRRPTLKELQEKEYPFPDSDVPYIFHELLERKLIELPESKRPDEAGRVNDPKYCKYHRVVSHPIERCFVVKEKIMALVKEGKILLDVEETVGTNVADITAANNRHVLERKQKVKQSSTTTLSALQFGSFELIQIGSLFVNEEKEISIEDDDGWTLVTHRWRQKRKVDKFHPSFPRNPRLQSNLITQRQEIRRKR